MATREEHPLFSFGIIADVQYGDLDDVLKRHGSVRRYRNALYLLREAVQHWKEEHRIQFVLQLGDIIDRRNTRFNTSENALRDVLQEFDGVPFAVHHIWGNHEFYNFSRNYLMNSPLFTAQENATVEEVVKKEADAAYYDFSPYKGYRFVVLDNYDVSMCGFARDKDSSQYKQAETILRQVNKNENLNSPEGLVGLDQRFVKFNGAVGEDQLQWLRETLEVARQRGEKIILSGHVPVHPKSCYAMCLLWNYQDVLNILEDFSDIVLAYFSGHNHESGYHYDSGNEIHHVTLPGVIEVPLSSNAFGTVDVFSDRLVMHGVGQLESRVMK
ncbi:ADPRM [Branchiostoma lanceolatum]|uniref:ADPRM protein n=1 Tax=Branchiostoma lanceolatum TaxID=7740 RepID=A0A8K0EYY6_BRALA|nr:ADPRM [Branchiostoma lanceolatum]